MNVDEVKSKLKWLWDQVDTPICPYCVSVYTRQYVLAEHGYVCLECGLDFGVVIKMERPASTNSLSFDAG
jgi:hypothetical protein